MQRQRDATFALMSICFIVFSAELFYPQLVEYFALARDSLISLALLMHIFTHLSGAHLVVNMIVLFLFGPELETIIGSRRFFFLFISAGAAAGLGQVFLFDSGVAGSSGAIMALLGCLTILNPRMRVWLFFILPIELWLATLLYAAYDLLFLGAATGIAHLAHLIGLGVGVSYGIGVRIHEATANKSKV